MRLTLLWSMSLVQDLSLDLLTSSPGHSTISVMKFLFKHALFQVNIKPLSYLHGLQRLKFCIIHHIDMLAVQKHNIPAYLPCYLSVYLSIQWISKIQLTTGSRHLPRRGHSGCISLYAMFSITKLYTISQLLHGWAPSFYFTLFLAECSTGNEW